MSVSRLRRPQMLPSFTTAPTKEKRQKPPPTYRAAAFPSKSQENYFPTQKFEKMRSITLSSTSVPVMDPR